ncbi:hypothetical protein LSCM1_03037 [Leishmania martiniquensis]|uniref:Uncharacterized protein n=1 Tax=Leishmania martiniquensis TaxID=1580590 RepID=A0A836H2Z6_9TRYP|nr:hypothetical protein LSCM1_03037 [Leishmania martiniquensis]
MHRPQWIAQTASLDQVVRHAVNNHSDSRNGSGGGGTFQSTSLLSSSALDGVSAASAVSRLVVQGSPSASVAQTPTVQAIHVLCHRFLETYATPEALARDTAWWSTEAARLHAAHFDGNAHTDIPGEAPPAAPGGWGEFIRHIVEVMESTHHIATAQRLEDSVPALSLPPMRQADTPGEVNVMQLSSEVQNGGWESLELLDSSPHGDEAAAAMHRDEECLRVIEAALQSDAHHCEEAEQLDSLRYLLKHRPELIVQSENVVDLERMVIDRACSQMKSGWLEAALSLFLFLPPRAQMDMVHAASSAVTTLACTGEPPGLLLVGFLHRLLLELPHGWLPLLDNEVTEVFVRVLRDVAVPFGRLLDELDPHAVWLERWSARPSFALSLDAVLRSHRSLVDDLAAQLPSSHATCVLLCLLPQLSECIVPQDPSTASSQQPWPRMFHALLQLLCGEIWMDAGVYDAGAHSLCRCAGALPPAEKEKCLDVVSRAVLDWVPTADSPAHDAQLAFALRLLATLLTGDGEQALWCSPLTWKLVDGPLFTQSRAWLLTRQRRLPSTQMLSRALQQDVVDVVRECWTRLLQAHTPKLPATLAAVVKDACDGGSAFRWTELVRVSTTVAGWAALQPYMYTIADGITHMPARWAELLHAIVEVGGGTLERSSEMGVVSTSSIHTSDKKTSRASACLRSLTPHGVALLLRWSTCPLAREGLAEAARDASLAFLRGSPHEAAQRMRWPLLWPVEAYPKVGCSDLSLIEDAFEVARAARAGACYQSIHLLLRSTALPSDDGADGCDPGRELLEELWGQLVDLWLAPAQLTPDSAGSGSLSVVPANRLPFGEDTLLTLLCAMALSVLVRPSAEFRAWFDPTVAQRRIRQLRHLCEERRGVDPVYFMVRFITSGKGRKRLPAIFLEGFEAELTVDAVCDVSSFTEGEAMPAGDISAAAAAATAEEEVQHPQAMLLHSSSGCSPPALEAEARTATPSPKFEVLESVARVLLANRAALRVTRQEVEQCLARRSADEWASYADTEARVLSVCAELEEQHSASAALLSSAHVDILFLVSLCLHSWLSLPATHSTPARRKLYWAALGFFSEHGIAAYDALVARSIALHVERAARESAGFVKEAALFPLSRPIPLPSALFAHLLVRPFALVTS